MAGNISVIENHPQKQQIIDSLLAGRSLRDIARDTVPQISIMAIQRYRKNVVAPIVRNASLLTKALTGKDIQQPAAEIAASNSDAKAVTQAALRGDTVLARLNAKWERLDGALNKALKTDNLSAAASLERADTDALRFYAELSGQIGSGTSENSMFIVAPRIVVNVQPSDQPPTITIDAESTSD